MDSKSIRVMNAGPAIDALVAHKFLGGAVRPYSTDANAANDIVLELGRRGLEVEYDDSDGVTCILKRDSREVISMWGLTFPEAICRSALKLMGSDPA